jgi:hypothetical protein
LYKSDIPNKKIDSGVHKLPGMNFLNKLFRGGNKKDERLENKRPENTKLNYLLNIWGDNHSNENFNEVLKEILEGNCYLLIPSINDNPGTGDWTTAEIGTTLKLTSVFNLDGLQVLGAFSDESSMLKWAKKETGYTSLRTQDIIEFCKQHKIDRIVINSGQKNIFVLERNRENIKKTTFEKTTPVQIGTPIKPVGKHIIDKLVLNFKKVDTIQEAYHYAQSLNNEFSLVIGVLLSVVSDNSKAALDNAINNSLQGEKLDIPVDIFVIQTEGWLNKIRNINNSLFYKR